MSDTPKKPEPKEAVASEEPATDAASDDRSTDEAWSEPDFDFQAELEAIVEGAAGLFGSLKDVFAKSRDEVVRSAQLGKVRIDAFQLQRDREHLLQRLGEEAFVLIAGGDLSHPALEKAFQKIQALDAEVEACQMEIEQMEAELDLGPETEAANEPPQTSEKTD